MVTVTPHLATKLHRLPWLQTARPKSCQRHDLPSCVSAFVAPPRAPGRPRPARNKNPGISLFFNGKKEISRWQNPFEMVILVTFWKKNQGRGRDQNPIIFLYIKKKVRKYIPFIKKGKNSLTSHRWFNSSLYNLPSREWVHIPPLEKENHRKEKCRLLVGEILNRFI